MKNSLLAVASLLSLLFTSCSIDSSRSLLQPDLQLVSPNGVRIAKSVKELEQLTNQMMKDGWGTDTTAITITSVDYRELLHSPKNSVAAVVHYRTARGVQGYFNLNAGRPELAN
jgi:hypothetical protein